jgi:ribosomal-protein-serine acetyltransferase
MLLPTRPILRGDLVIRPYRNEDAAALVQSVTESIEHLRPWMPWIAHEPQSVDDRRAFIAESNANWAGGGDMGFGIFIGEKVVGGCGLHRRVGPTGLEIGYWVHVDHVGRGIATTAAGALTSAAFTLPPIAYVEIHHDKANVASGRVPEKLGFVLVAEAPDEIQSPADIGIDCAWSISRESWHGEPPWPD